MKRYTVLSYIVNDYEIVREIEVKDPEAEYILVTDNAALHSDTWTVVCDSDLDGMAPFDKTFAIRYNCFKYCTTDICLRIDGSIKVKQSLRPLVDMFEEGGYDAALMVHPKHTDFISEYKAWVKDRNYPKSQSERCLKDMAARGYDFAYKGLFQTCFSIQRKGSITEKIDDTVFNYLRKLGQNGQIERLDQIPFSYIINTQFSHLRIMPVSEQILRSHCMQWFGHRSTRPVFPEPETIENVDRGFMFNKEVRLVTLYPYSDMEIIVGRERELIRDFVTEIHRLDTKNDKHLRMLRLVAITAMALAVMLITILLFFPFGKVFAIPVIDC
ncbi:MAG: hypothetical protein NC116_05750 [Clostridium sp.]|nr:hypothetical protein [Clostridium sp.]